MYQARSSAFEVVCYCAIGVIVLLCYCVIVIVLLASVYLIIKWWRGLYAPVIFDDNTLFSCNVTHELPQPSIAKTTHKSINAMAAFSRRIFRPQATVRNIELLDDTCLNDSQHVVIPICNKRCQLHITSQVPASLTTTRVRIIIRCYDTLYPVNQVL